MKTSSWIRAARGLVTLLIIIAIVIVVNFCVDHLYLDDVAVPASNWPVFMGTVVICAGLFYAMYRLWRTPGSLDKAGTATKERPHTHSAPRLVAGSTSGDIALGIGAVILLPLAGKTMISFLGLLGIRGIGTGRIIGNFVSALDFLMPILYFVLRRNFPFFARGIGFGILAGVGLILGGVILVGLFFVGG